MAALRRRAVLAATLVCLAYAALAQVSGLDRLSLSQPQLTGKVPAPFASRALRSEGARLISRGEARPALVLGEAAVRDAPLDPASTALLGIARFQSGDRAGADRAFRIAGQLGWRETYTQTYWMGRALEIGDWRVAAMRLDAILRQRPALLAERRLLDPLESVPAGRAALAKRMLPGPNWLAPYTAAVSDVPRPVLLLRAQVLGEVAARKGVLGCTSVAPLAERLVIEAAETEAAVLWRQHCPGAATTLVYDGRFENASLNQDRSQFSWFFIGQSDVNLMLEPVGTGGAKQLVIASSTERPRQLLRQLVLIAPGIYRLSWAAVDRAGKPSDLVAAALTCEQVPNTWLAGRFDPATRRWTATLSVDSACKARWLSFGVNRARGDAVLGDIRIEPVN